MAEAQKTLVFETQTNKIAPSAPTADIPAPDIAKNISEIKIIADETPAKNARSTKTPKADSSEKTQDASKPKKAERAPRLPKGPKPEKQVSGGGSISGSSAGNEVSEPVVAESPPIPRDATRPGEAESIVYIAHAELFPFKAHPFQVRDDEAMKSLVESVKERGIDQPALVRPREDGGYELVSGHRRQHAAEAALEIYCTGSLNVFNHHTNVNTDKRVVCIVLKKLGAGLRKIAMHVTNELSWVAVDKNFRQGLYTWCYYDEFHILLRDALTASYFVAIWKMLRKKGCVPSALTQNVKDLLASREIENILETSDFLILLSQAAGDREILARQLGISPHQLSYVTHSGSGEGLLFYGDTTIPFVDRFPKNTEIYRLLTTRPEDLKNEVKNE